jgi:hypothetical protein
MEEQAGRRSRARRVERRGAVFMQVDTPGRGG